jgi:hypothetical protein
MHDDRLIVADNHCLLLVIVIAIAIAITLSVATGVVGSGSVPHGLQVIIWIRKCSGAELGSGRARDCMHGCVYMPHLHSRYSDFSLICV